jgi:hypothetical protein
MAGNHTPGPWVVWSPNEFGNPSIGRESGPSLAIVFRSNHEAELEANARLIAAAPDLLAALEHAEYALTRWAMYGHSDRPPEQYRADEWARDARAAIAKAKGTDV